MSFLRFLGRRLNLVIVVLLLSHIRSSQPFNMELTADDMPAVGEPVPYSEYLDGVLGDAVLKGKSPPVTADPNKLEDQARDTMNTKGFSFISGGAGERATMDANRLAFRQWKIVPRMLVPTTPRDLSVKLFGRRYRSPVIMAPIGVHSLYNADKEVGTARACASLDVTFTLSTSASTGIDELAHKVPKGDKWYQLYWSADDDLTASLLRRAWARGYQTLVVTLDASPGAWRPLDIDTASIPYLTGQGNQVGFEDPVFRRKFAKMSRGMTPESNVTAASRYWTKLLGTGAKRSWKDLGILRRQWKGPIVLKAIQSVEDARLAVKYGMDGIVVSNHGGRTLDGAQAALGVLPDIVDAVGHRITVMMDSGIRTGADIFKALSLGAEAVLVGRPVVYGLGINGTAGARAVLAGLLADLDFTMGTAGVKTVKELDRSRIRSVHYPGDVASSN